MLTISRWITRRGPFAANVARIRDNSPRPLFTLFLKNEENRYRTPILSPPSFLINSNEIDNEISTMEQPVASLTFF